MERREFIAAVSTTAMGVAALGSATEALAQNAGMQDMKGMKDMQDMHAPKYKALEESTGKCVGAGEDCLRHCVGMVSMNDTTMSGCLNAVIPMIAAVRALQTIASVNSSFAPDFAKTTASVCDACEKECRKWYDKVVECRACADACKQCGDECRKLAARFSL